MENKSLIFKTFIRFIKEKNMFFTFKKATDEKYNAFMIEVMKNRLNIFSLNHFMGHCVMNDENQGFIYDFNKFCINPKNIKEFNEITINIIKNDVTKFLKKNKIFKPFIDNLCKHHKFNDVCGDGEMIIEQYFNYLIEKGYPIHKLISTAFLWHNTKEKETYWRTINNKYINFLKDLLLGT